MARTTKPKPPSATTILLVRHGQTPTTGTKLPGRAAGLHLSDKGRDQAYAAAARIAKLDKVTAVYASPLERTRETAAPIADSTSSLLFTSTCSRATTSPLSAFTASNART